MRIKVHIGNRSIRRALLLLAAHHARQTLRRLRAILPRLTMTLSEVGPSLEGLGKRCVVELRAGKSKVVVMSSTARTWQDAIKLSLRQASERLTELSTPGLPTTRQRLVTVDRPRLR